MDLQGNCATVKELLEACYRILHVASLFSNQPSKLQLYTAYLYLIYFMIKYLNTVAYELENTVIEITVIKLYKLYFKIML